MTIDHLAGRPAPIGGLSPRPVAMLRKTLAVMKREMDAGERTWMVVSLSPNCGELHLALDKICADGSKDKAIAFFGKNAGNAIQVDRNIKTGYIRIYDPINNKTLSSTKSLIFRKYQFFFFAEKDEPVILGCLGSRPTVLIYPQRKIMIDIVPNKEDRYNFINAVIKLVRHYGLDFYRHLTVGGSAKTACMIGDERPTHYLLESLGAMQKLEESGRMDSLWKSLDYLIIPTDYSFIPADELFNVPRSVQVAYVPLADVNKFAMDRNLFVQRFMRSGHNMSDVLRRRVIDYSNAKSKALDWPDTRKVLRHTDHVTVWFSVEIEKGRIQNQSEVFQELVSILTARFGSRFRMIVDGWSPMPLSTAPKDKLIAAKIRAFLRDEMKAGSYSFDVIEAFTLPYRDKIKLCSVADFFVTMQGAAALVPSGLCHKPGVTYHNAWGLASELEVWTENLDRVPPRKEWAPPGQGAGRAAFEVDIPLFRTTVEALIKREKLELS